MITETYTVPFSKMTEARMSAEDSINKMAQGNLDAVSKVVTSILYSSYPVIESYILYNGEKPAGDPLSCMIQAAIIRGKEIANEAAAIDGSDIDGLHSLEDKETISKELNYPDSEYILPPDVGAALKKMLERLKSIKSDKDCDCQLYDLINSLKKDGSNYGDKFTVFELIGDYTQDDPLYNEEYWKDQATIWSSMYPVLSNSFDGEPPVTQEVAAGKDIFTAINNIFGSVKSEVESTADQIKNLGSDIGSQSIKKFFEENIPVIIGIIILIGAVIFISIYAANNSSKS